MRLTGRQWFLLVVVVMAAVQWGNSADSRSATLLMYSLGDSAVFDEHGEFVYSP